MVMKSDSFGVSVDFESRVIVNCVGSMPVTVCPVRSKSATPVFVIVTDCSANPPTLIAPKSSFGTLDVMRDVPALEPVSVTIAVG